MVPIIRAIWARVQLTSLVLLLELTLLAIPQAHLRLQFANFGNRLLQPVTGFHDLGAAKESGRCHH